MNRVFENDLRNVGGMQTITEQLYNHHLALVKVKPIVNAKPPKSISSAKAKDSHNKKIKNDPT